LGGKANNTVPHRRQEFAPTPFFPDIQPALIDHLFASSSEAMLASTGQTRAIKRGATSPHPPCMSLQDRSPANREPSKTAAPMPCKRDQWRVIVEMSDPLPLNSREIEIIENYFADIIDDLLLEKPGK
jgi:hypothetical protein